MFKVIETFYFELTNSLSTGTQLNVFFTCYYLKSEQTSILSIKRARQLLLCKTVILKALNIFVFSVACSKFIIVSEVQYN